MKFVLDGKNETSTYVTPIRPLSGDSAPIGAIATVATGPSPLLWRLGTGTVRLGTGTVTVSTYKEKIHKPDGETLAPLRSRAQVLKFRLILLRNTFQLAGRGLERGFGERTRERQRA